MYSVLYNHYNKGPRPILRKHNTYAGFCQEITVTINMVSEMDYRSIIHITMIWLKYHQDQKMFFYTK